MASPITVVILKIVPSSMELDIVIRANGTTGDAAISENQSAKNTKVCAIIFEHNACARMPDTATGDSYLVLCPISSSSIVGSP